MNTYVDTSTQWECKLYMNTNLDTYTQWEWKVYNVHEYIPLCMYTIRMQGVQCTWIHTLIHVHNENGWVRRIRIHTLIHVHNENEWVRRIKIHTLIHVHNENGRVMRIRIHTLIHVQKENGRVRSIRIHTLIHANVFIFQKNDRFVMITTTKTRKRNDRF